MRVSKFGHFCYCSKISTEINSSQQGTHDFFFSAFLNTGLSKATRNREQSNSEWKTYTVLACLWSNTFENVCLLSLIWYSVCVGRKKPSSNRSTSVEQWRCSVRGTLCRLNYKQTLVFNPNLQHWNVQYGYIFLLLVLKLCIFRDGNRMFVKVATTVFLRVVFCSCTSKYSVTYHVISFVRAAN